MEKILDLRWLVISACLVALALFICMRPALAVHANGTFELEGDADDDSGAGLPDDWETLYNGGSLDGGSATAFSFTTDKFESGADDYFTGGGSKTPNEIGDWSYKIAPPSAPPDKNNITHAYAANYNVGGEQIVYFGADLFDDNGDAELAFWLFQEEITQVPTTPGGPSAGFIGNHVLHDPYIAVKFANGGTQALIAVYEWDPSCTKPPGNGPFPAGGCAANNIRVVIPEGPATCTGAPAGDVACAITNTSNQASPWPYIPKDDAPANVFPPTTFFEGGINIFDVFGQNLCFSSFMAQTGASTSFTSTSKDFSLGSFSVCSVGATKTCANDDEESDTPNNITYNIRGCAINDGGGSINITSLENSIGGGSAYTPVDLAWYVPGQVDDGGGLRDFNPATDCDDEALLLQAVSSGSVVTDLSSEDLDAGEALVYAFSESGPSNGPSDEVTIDAEGTDGSDIDADSDTAICPTLDFNASLSVSKQCAADLEDAGSTLVVRIDFEGEVCNTGEVDLTNLVLSDDIDMPTGVTVTFSLDPDSTHTDPDTSIAVGECVAYEGYYYPDSIPTGDICPFMDQVTATVDAPINVVGTGCTLQADLTSECEADSNSATCNLRAVNGDGDCSTGPLSPLPSP